MIGSLAASPVGDGVDFGGHFWIPEGTASNIEELELLWPMLFLYRRALKAGADGAGRFRGGRSFVEGGIPWTVPGMAAAVYVDESFPKAVGPFGGNPGSAGHFRLKHGTDVAGRFAAGEVPQDFDAIDGAEAEVEAKGPMLMMEADAAWEWTGAHAPGLGDPFATGEGRAGHRMRYREYLCPVTGLRVDSEIIKEGDKALHDIVVGGADALAIGRGRS